MLKLPVEIPLTLTIGSANALQIVRATIECPTEDTVSVVLAVQGVLLDDNGNASTPMPLPQIELSLEASAAIYASVRDAIYEALQVDPSVSIMATTAKLSALGGKA